MSSRQRILAVSGASPWRLVTAYEGAAVTDNSSMCATKTIAADGLITLIPDGAFATQLDGYTEDGAMATQLLSVVAPNYLYTDPDAALELLFKIASMPAGTHKYGIAIGVTDSSAANVATSVGGQAHCFTNSGTTWNVGVHSATGTQTSVSQGSTQPDYLYARIKINPSTRGIVVTGAVRNTAGTWQTLTSFSGEAGTLSATTANWRAVVKLIHVSAVAGTPTVSGRLYVRESRGSPFP